MHHWGDTRTFKFKRLVGAYFFVWHSSAIFFLIPYTLQLPGVAEPVHPPLPDSPTFCRPPWPYGRATRTPGVKYLKARHNQRIVAGLFPERAGLSMQDIPWAKPSFRQELKPRPSEKSGFWPQSSLQQQASESWDGFLLDVRGIVLVPDGAGSHCRELHN